MPLSDSAVQCAQYIKGVLEASTDPKFEFVAYGDSDLIPKVPAATVFAGDKRRELAGATFQTELEIQVIIMLYHSTLDDDHARQLAADELGENVEALLHSGQHNQAGGLVIHGFCTSVENGYTLRNEEIMRTCRITWSGMSKVRINT